MNTDISFSKLAETSFKMRERLAEITHEYDAKYKELADKKALVDIEMLRQMQERGVSSEKVIGVGTVYTYKAVKASIADDAIFYSWVREKDAFEALERRVKSSFVQTYMDEHSGEAPPGLNIYTEIQARLRKSTDKQ